MVRFALAHLVSRWHTFERSPQKKMIRCYRVTDRAEVEAIIGSGLRDLETLARLLNPPEDEGYFKEEYEELCAGLNDDPRSWWIEVSKEGVLSGRIIPLGLSLSLHRVVERVSRPLC